MAASVVESLTEVALTTAEFLTKTGMTREEADQVAKIIQEAFRKHLSIKLTEQQNGDITRI